VPRRIKADGEMDQAAYMCRIRLFEPCSGDGEEISLKV
jgi:hypothetical protein